MLGNLTKFGVIPRGLWNTVSYGPFLIYFATRHAALGIKFGEIAALVLARHAAVGTNDGMFALTRGVRHAVVNAWFNLSDYLTITDIAFTATSVTFNANILSVLPFDTDALVFSIAAIGLSTTLADVSVGTHALSFTVAEPQWTVTIEAVPERSGVVIGDGVSTSASYFEYATGDEHWANVVLLSGFDNAVAVDEGPSAHVLTPATTGIAYSTEHAAVQSNYALAVNTDGSTAGHVAVSTPADFQFGTVSFTIECFFTLHSLPSAASIIGTYKVGSYLTWYLQITADGHIVFSTYHYNTALRVKLTSVTTLSIGDLTHLAVTRDGATGTLRLFINGVLEASLTSANDVGGTSTTAYCCIGGDNQNGNCRGYIDEVRITKGVCRYTANFTVPTMPYPRGA